MFFSLLINRYFSAFFKDIYAGAIITIKNVITVVMNANNLLSTII